MSKFELPKTLTTEERRKYFRENDGMAKMFGQDMVDVELDQLKVSDILALKFIPHDIDPITKRVMKASPSNFYHQYLGEEVQDGKQGYVYLDSYMYQSTKHSSMIESMMVQKLPFLSRVRFEAYQLTEQNADNYEIYVRFAQPLDVNKHSFTWNSLYVPFKALVENDMQAIIDRNTSYIKDYFDLFKTKGADVDPPFNMDSLKIYAEDVLGYTGEDFENSVHSLRKQELISNHWESGNKSIEDLNKESGSILNALSNNFDIAFYAKTDQISQAFKHSFYPHAIIPTTNPNRVQIEDLSDIDRGIYSAIAMRYINQFLPTDPAKNLTLKVLNSPEIKKLGEYMTNGLNNETVVLTRDLEGPLLDSVTSWILQVDASDLNNHIPEIFRELNQDASKTFLITRSPVDGIYESSVDGHLLKSDDSVELMKKVFVSKKLGFSITVPDHMMKTSKPKNSM